MQVGFTGNRFGMTLKQKITLTKYLENSIGSTFHHGMCVGSDEEASHIAHSLGYFNIGYPGVSSGGDGDTYRSHNCKVDSLREEKTHFARNRDIVNISEILFATPKEFGEKDKGGTWFTINYARKIGKPNIVIWPDGTTEVRK